MESRMSQTARNIAPSSRESMMQSGIHNDNSNTSISGSGDIHNNNQINNYLVSTNARSEADATQAKIAAALHSRNVSRAVYNAHLSSGCLAGTRIDILRMIEIWIESPEEPPIFWLAGMAGMGKTAIAWTVCSHAEASTNIVLGGSFFCSRSTGSIAQRDVRCVIPTLAQLMALQSPKFSETLAEELARDPGVLEKQIGVQIERLLYKPLLALKDSRIPILFVIDALDECGGLAVTDEISDDAETHRIVSEMLEAPVAFSRFPVKLPVKFLVTSRPETHIRDTLVQNSALSTVLRLHTVAKSQVTADIYRYISAGLSSSPRLRDRFTAGENQRLALLCDGLFIFAATALRYILGGGIDAAAMRFETLLNPTRDGLGTSAAVPLDRMYNLILEDALEIGNPNNNNLPAVRQIFASLLCARMTLSVTALADLLDQPKHHVRGHLSRLHSVVHVPDDDGEPGLYTLHASFGDYLFRRAPTYVRISESIGHEILGCGCLRRMMWADLCFNVSRSRSSFMGNSSSTANHLMLSLVYACLQWAYHITACSDPPALDNLIEQAFIPNFLFWLEVLSVLGKVGAASGLLRLARSTAKQDHISRFLRDANSFVASSREAIERSAPHIYLSALPFAARDSLVYQIFAPLCTGLVSVEVYGIGCHGDRLAMMLTGHDDEVCSVGYSPDGHLLASGSKDGTVRIWNTRTGEETMAPLLSGNGAVNSIAFAPDGKSIVSGTRGGVHIWTGLDGQPTVLYLSGHTGGVLSVAFSPDGCLVASGSEDRTTRLWRADTGSNVAVLNRFRQINAVAFSPDCHTVACGPAGDEIYLIDSRTGTDVGVLNLCSGSMIVSIDFSAGGKLLASGATDGTITIWDYRTRNTVTALRGHVGLVRSVQFSPDGESLVSAADDKSVRLWTLSQSTGHDTSTVLSGHSDRVYSAKFSPDGLYIVSASKDSTIRIWDAATGEQAIQPLPAHEGTVCSTAVSPDGSCIVSGSRDYSVRVWDMRNGEPKLPPLLGHTASVHSVVISSDGRLIASASSDRTIRLWNTETGEAISEPIQIHNGAINAVTFAPDTMLLASGSQDKTVCMWDAATWPDKGYKRFTCTDEVNTVAFSRDGRLLAAGDSGGRIHFWQVATGQPVRKPIKANSSVGSVSFSPVGTRIASAESRTVCIWDIATGRMIWCFERHTTWMASVAFSPNERLLCTCSNEALYLWDTSTGALITTLHGHGAAVQSAVFAPDGQSVVSCADNGTIRVWNIEQACSQPSDGSEHVILRLTFTKFTQNRSWALGRANELLLWIPEEYRAFLQVPPCLMIIGSRRIVVTAEVDGLYHGEDWTKCWRHNAHIATFSHSM